jgi:hypothetical protein
MKSLQLLALSTLLLPIAAQAQSAPAGDAVANPITVTVKQQLGRSSRIMVQAADMMPAEKYSFAPMPGMMTFGQQIQHDAQFFGNLCAQISGKPAPDTKDLKDTDPKDKLVAALKSMFDFCTSALANVDDSNLGQVVGKLGPNNLTRGGALILLSDEFADHYGAEGTYLRLNNMLPPTAQPAKK